MNKIDSVGTYIGEITEHSLGQSSGGFPQFVFRFKAVQKWIDDAEGMKHFGLTEPAYVDWSSFDEGQLGYLVLFNADKALMNYEQVQLAIGWEGNEFDSLNTGKYLGKQVLVRIETNEYQGKTSLQVAWIDAADAAPERTLKALDPTAVAGLAAKFLAGKAKPVAAATAPAKPGKPGATPATKPTSPAASQPRTSPATPAAPSTPTSTVPAAPSTPAAPTSPTTTSPSNKPPKAPKVQKTEAPAEEKPTLPAETTQEGGWIAVHARKGNVDDTAIQDAWIKACQKVGGNDRDEDDFNGADWAKVRDEVIAELKL